MADPLLFLDVDGPLNAYAASAESRRSWLVVEDLFSIDPDHGPALLALPCQLVWATAWEHQANAEIAPVLGLPELPVVEWPPVDPPVPFGVHWKTQTLIEWADGLPFAWVDDEITDADREWVASEHPGEALLLEIDPAYGLLPGDFTRLADWFGEVAG